MDRTFYTPIQIGLALSCPFRYLLVPTVENIDRSALTTEWHIRCTPLIRGVSDMRSFQGLIRSALAGLFVLLALVEVAWPQSMSPGLAAEREPGYWLFALVFAIASLAISGFVLSLRRIKRKREDEAIALQARFSDALVTEPSLSRLPIIPTVRVPFGGYPQAVIMLTGVVPTPALREGVLQFVKLEAAFLTDTFRIEDRLVVTPRRSRRAA